MAKAPKPRVQKRTQIDVKEIARRAYELFLQRGGGHGHDIEDWLAAEQELRGN